MSIDKKIAALLIAAIMVLMVLGGCAGGGSAFENAEWVMTGTFDSNKLLFTYNDCVKTDRVYKDEGVVESETVEYTDGAGTMQFTEDLTFTWQDDKENA